MKSIWKILSFVAIAFAIYSPALSGSFLWDDDSYVQFNQAIRSFENLYEIWFIPGSTPQYYPLVFTTYLIEYQLWGLNPVGFHITNLLLHIGTVLLLWRILVLQKIKGAWLAAIVFLVHPLQVESVAWITERKNVLAGLFLMASTYFYLRFQDKPSNKALYWRSLAFFVGALLSKTVSAMLPPVLLIFLWFKRRKLHVEDFYSLVPFFLVGGIFSYFTVLMERQFVGAVGEYWNYKIWEKALIAARVLCFYVGKFLWPHPLIFNYPRWEVRAEKDVGLICLVICLIVFSGLWMSRKKTGKGPIAIFSIYGVLIFPALGFFNVYPFRYSFVADHFAYFALVAFAVGFGVVLFRFKILSVLIVAVFCLLTWKQSRAYKNMQTLWADTLDKNPSSILANHNFGVLLLKRGQFVESIPYFLKSIEADPQNVESHVQAGLALFKTGQWDQASVFLDRAIKINPNAFDGYCFLGELRFRQKRYKEAVELLNHAILLGPWYMYSHSILGRALFELGEKEAAIKHVTEAAQQWPQLAETHLHLGVVLLRLGKKELALSEFNLAQQLNSFDPITRQELAEYARVIERESQ